MVEAIKRICYKAIEEKMLIIIIVETIITTKLQAYNLEMVNGLNLILGINTKTLF